MFGGIKMGENVWKELIKEVADNPDGQVFNIFKNKRFLIMILKK